MYLNEAGVACHVLHVLMKSPKISKLVVNKNNLAWFYHTSHGSRSPPGSGSLGYYSVVGGFKRNIHPSELIFGDCIVDIW